MATSVDQKLLRQTKFPLEFSQKVDMKKVNVEVMKRWIAGQISDILGNEDDVVVELCFNLLEGSRFPDIKTLQIQLTGFLDKDTPKFCKELWNLCLSAQANPQGVPGQLLEAKKLELLQEKNDAEKAAEEARRRQEQEKTRERNVDDVRQRERADRGRGRGSGRGGRPYEPPRPRDSRSPPSRRRRESVSPPRRRRDSPFREPVRREADTYIPPSRPGRRSNGRGRSPTRSLTRSSSSPSRSRTPPRRQRNVRLSRSRSRSRSRSITRSRTPPRRRKRRRSITKSPSPSSSDRSLTRSRSRSRNRNRVRDRRRRRSLPRYEPAAKRRRNTSSGSSRAGEG